MEGTDIFDAVSHLSNGVAYEEIVAYADKTPPLPQSVIKVIELVDNPGTDTRRLVDAVSADPVLVALLLKLANSTLFAHAGDVTSVLQSVLTVGFAKLRSLALAMSLRGVLNRNAVDKLVWEHSIATAMTARKLAAAVAPKFAEEIFTMGLLHRLGQFVMLANNETRKFYPAILCRIRESGTDYVTAEKEVMGFAHPLVSALVAARWNFPPQFCHVILHYTEPVGKIETVADQKLALIKLSSLIATAARLGKPEGHAIEIAAIERLTHLLNFTHPDLDVVSALITEARQQFTEEAHLWTS